MVSQLTIAERQRGCWILGVLAVLGLAMAASDPHGLFGAQGYVVAIFCGVLLCVLLRHLLDPEPSAERFNAYYDDPSKVGIILAMIWAIAGLGAGVWVAALLAWPDFTFDAAWSSYGRLRPLHTSGVIFGFGGNGLLATSFHVVQRTSRARLADQFSPWFVLIGYNLFCVVAATGYLMGVTQSKEYAEPEWYADLWLVVVWVTYLVLYLRTLARRKEPHIYVANWYFLAFIIVVAMLHIVNNLAVPLSLGSAKSYVVWSGVQDAMVQWWYGHNAVAFFLTAGFLGMMYYYLPKRAGRPIYSYRMSIVGFWGITFFYMWAGSHHLHYTALPQWVQTLGMTFSVMLIVPSWIAAANALLTLNGAWDKVRSDATLRFMTMAAIFYGRARPVAVEARRDVFGQAGRGPLLARSRRDAHLRPRDVEWGHPPGPDVADLQRQRYARLFVRGFDGGDAPLLYRPHVRRAAVPDRRRRRLLQRADDRAPPARRRRRRAAARSLRPRAGGVAARCSAPTTSSSASRSASRSRSCSSPASAG
jgi:cytochrome c oxidase cbb3-type subunit I